LGRIEKEVDRRDGLLVQHLSTLEKSDLGQQDVPLLFRRSFKLVHATKEKLDAERGNSDEEVTTSAEEPPTGSRQRFRERPVRKVSASEPKADRASTNIWRVIFFLILAVVVLGGLAAILLGQNGSGTSDALTNLAGESGKKPTFKMGEKFSGEGIGLYADGQTFEGTFVDGKPYTGYGRVEREDGVYSGFYHEGQRHGRGDMFHNRKGFLGGHLSGVWTNDRLKFAPSPLGPNGEPMQPKEVPLGEGIFRYRG
jgi:hypothetical protein